MIGQQELLKQMMNLWDSKSFPRFSILVGLNGSGKRTLVRKFAKSINIPLVELPDTKADTVRDMIANAYQQAEPIIYLIADADKMRAAAKNTMLKVTEEPPNNAYIIMTLQDIKQTLDTIKSRGTTFIMERYTPEQLIDYYNKKYGDNLIPEEKTILTNLCETPVEVDLMKQYDFIDFYKAVENVVDHIATVSGANSFKIIERLSLKEDDGKYDIHLFWKAFMTACNEKMKQVRIEADPAEVFRYTTGVQITSKYLQQLSVQGINKQMCFDAWLLDIRKAWM